MSAEEKQRITDAWDKHIGRTVSQHKYASFSSIAEEDFCETFRVGIMAQKGLTRKEKLEIFTYARL